jgi:hypothetical protein
MVQNVIAASADHTHLAANPEHKGASMATPAQIAANRANSQKSTGPTSTEGKAKSSLNHLSHGFASSTKLIDGEDPEELKALHYSLLDELQPATVVETILVEKMSQNQWLSLRALRLQARRLNQQANSLDDETPKDLGLLIRYQTSADRAFHKAHASLLKLQKERKNSEIGFDPQNAEAPAEDSPELATQPIAATKNQDVVNEILTEFRSYEADVAEMLGVSVAELKRAA